MQTIHQEEIPVNIFSPAVVQNVTPLTNRFVFFAGIPLAWAVVLVAFGTAALGVVIPVRPAGAADAAHETVVQWKFSRDDDRNFDNNPDGWKRTYGRMFPRYLKLDIVPHDVSIDEMLRRLDAEILDGWLTVRPYTQKIPAGSLWIRTKPGILQTAQMVLIHLPSLPPSISDWLSNRYLRGEVNGGAIASTSPSYPVDLDYSYRLQARIKTEGLVHNQAWVQLSFLDEDGAVIESLPSRKLRGDNPWMRIDVGPAAPPRKAKLLQISVHFEPDSRADLSGRAGFDDLIVTRFPRIRIETDSPLALYAETASPKVKCIVSGISAEGETIAFKVLNDKGEIVRESTVPLVEGGLLSATGATRSGDANRGPTSSNNEDDLDGNRDIGGVAEWEIPQLGPGFYRIQANLAGAQESSFAVEQTIALVSDLPNRGGPFGWSITGPDRTKIPLSELPDWLQQCRVQWLKYSCWIGPKDLKSADDLAWLAGRLQDRDIKMVGVLDNPPASVLADLSSAADDPVAILFRDAEVWQPVLEPVMTRLSSGIHWWQLGNDRDYSFLGRPQLAQAIEEIRKGLQGFGQPIEIALNWPWLERIPDRDEWSWHTVVLGERTPFTGQEIDAYFEQAGDSLAAESDVAANAESNNLETDSNTADDSTIAVDEVEKNSETFRNASFRPAEFVKEITADTQASELMVQRPWIILEPLPKSKYSRSDRIQDLVTRMLAVRRQKIPAAFVSQPFNPELGFLRQDGSPDEMLLPWRTSAALLANMYPVGSLELPNETENVLLANADTAIMVIWSDRVNEETLYLGEDAKQIDAFGREIPIEQVVSRGFNVQKFQVTSEPSFIVNMDRTAALWRLGVRLDRERIDSLLGREQIVNLIYQNPAAQGLNGNIRVEAPEPWNVSSAPRLIAAEPFRERQEPLSIILRADATIGREMIAIDFELEGDRKRQFTVWRPLEVGPEDIKLDVSTRLLPDGRLVVRQEITNTASTVRQFDCYVFAPGRRRQRRSTIVEVGQTTVQEFVWDDGQELLGKDLLLSAEQQGGDRTLNFRFKATK